MRRPDLTAIVLGTLLSLASSQQITNPDPSTGAAAVGQFTGKCDAGRFSVQSGSMGTFETTFSVIFDNLSVSEKPGSTSCGLMVPISVPPGYQARTKNITMRFYAELEEKARASISYSSSFPDTAASSGTKRLVGPTFMLDAENMFDMLPESQRTVSPCGESAALTLNISTALILPRLPKKQTNIVEIRTITGALDVVRCDTGKGRPWDPKNGASQGPDTPPVGNGNTQPPQQQQPPQQYTQPPLQQYIPPQQQTPPPQQYTPPQQQQQYPPQQYIPPQQYNPQLQPQYPRPPQNYPPQQQLPWIKPQNLYPGPVPLPAPIAWPKQPIVSVPRPGWMNEPRPTLPSSSTVNAGLDILKGIIGNLPKGDAPRWGQGHPWKKKDGDNDEDDNNKDDDNKKEDKDDDDNKDKDNDDNKDKGKDDDEDKDKGKDDDEEERRRRWRGRHGGGSDGRRSGHKDDDDDNDKGKKDDNDDDNDKDKGKDDDEDKDKEERH